MESSEREQVTLIFVFLSLQGAAKARLYEALNLQPQLTPSQAAILTLWPLILKNYAMPK
jgi:hypothetical protein